MELKEPKWVPVSEGERNLYWRFPGNISVTLPAPDNRKATIRKSNGLFIEVCDLPPIHVVTRVDKDIEKVVGGASDFVFRCIETFLQEEDSRSKTIRQKQLEVLRLFEVQHDAGRQLPTTSSSGQLP